MEPIETSSQKGIVERLNFGKKTAKRVAWEAWEFTVVGPHQVRVTNASYGYLKDEHAYVVGVELRDGQPVPAECECPADLYSEDYDCKHKVALAAIGGLPVLNAAINFEILKPEATETKPVTTAADKLKTDGGVPVKVETIDKSEADADNEDANEECYCTDYSDDPCWPCFRDNRKNL